MTHLDRPARLRRPAARASLMLALEPRFMFDGAAVADVAQAAVDGDAVDVHAMLAEVPAAVTVREADPALNGGRKEVAFIDTAVADYKVLEAGIRQGVEIVEIGGGADGLAQMAAWAETHSGYDAIHVLGHGGDGTIILGAGQITNASLADATVKAELAILGQALTTDGDLLVYGCSVAGGDDGASFLAKLAAITGADVAASDDPTGAADQGGDWILESRAGDVATAPAVDEAGRAAYGHVLATFTFDTTSGSPGTVTTTVSGITLTATSSIGAAITDNGSFGGTADNLLHKDDSDNAVTSDALNISFSAAVDITSMRLIVMGGPDIGDNNGVDMVIRLTPTGGSNSVVDLTITDYNLSGATATVNWTGVTSFTITPLTAIDTSPSATINNPGADFGVDTIVFTPSVSDSTAPTFDVAPAASAVTGTTLTFSGSLDEAGTVYYVAVANNAAAPSVAQVMAGQDSSGAAALKSDNSVVGSTPFTASFSVTGLTAGTDYDFYMVAKDSANNQMATVTKVDVTTGPDAANDTAAATEAGGNANGTAGTDPTGNVLTNDTGSSLSVTSFRTGDSEGAGTAGTLGQARAGSYGSLTLAANGSYTYAVDNTNATVQALAAGATLTDSFNYTIQNGSGGTDIAVLTVTITGVNDLPSLGGSFTTNGTVNDDSTATPFANVTFTDVDSNGTVTITFTGANGTLSSPSGGLTENSSGNYTLTSDTAGNIQTKLQALVFTPTANQAAPGSTVVTTFTVTPADTVGSGTADATTQVTATSVNNAPAISAGGTMAYTEKTPAVIAPAITISDSDVDSDWVGGNAKLTVQITANADANDSLSLPTTNPGAGGVWVDTSAGNALKIDTTTIGTASAASVTAGALLTLTFTGATDAQVQAVARALTFDSDTFSPSTSTRTVTFTAYDKTVGSSSATRDISVTATPDKPTLTGLTSPATSTALVENTIQTTPVQIFTAGTIADTDSTHFNGGYLRITGVGSGDLLSVNNQGTDAGQISLAGSTVSYGGAVIGTVDGTENGSAGAALKITFTTTEATIAAANALLQNILFSTGDAPAASRTLSVTVQDGTASAVSTAVTAVVNVTASNDQPGVISDGDAGANSVAENASVGATVGVTAASTDPDGTALTYTLTDDAGGKFAIHSTTGVVTVAAALDYETATSHAITVQASDGTLTRTQNFTITVTNVNENPIISSGTTATVSEAATNGTAVIDVNANDGDGGATDTGLTYTIQSGNTGSVFAIDAATGAITVANALDREITGSYTLVVRATDGGGAFTNQTITVTIGDVNDSNPVISSNGGGATAAVSIAENTTAVTTLTATDADSAPTQTYSIIGGADSALFAINAGTGVLTFATARDFETPADQGDTAGNNTYVVQVQVSDGTNTDTQTITVTITNVDENPVFISTGTVSLEKGGSFTHDLNANDGDGGGADTGMTYAFVGANQGLTLNATTGVLTGGAALAAGTHTVVVRATDGTGHTTDQTITITVTEAVVPPTTAAPAPTPPTPAPVPQPLPPPIGDTQPVAPLVTVVRDVQPSTDAPPATVTIVSTSTGGDGGQTGQTGQTGGGPATVVGAQTVQTIPSALTAPSANAFQVAVAVRPAGGGEALVVNAPMRDTVVTEGSRISVTIPAEAFAHTKADATVSLVATRDNGAALPGWMVFNPQTGTFEGTPPPGFRGEVVVRVVARDNDGREAVQTFKIVVGQGAGTVAPGQGQGQGPNGEGQGQPQGAPGQTGEASPQGAPGQTGETSPQGDGKLAATQAVGRSSLTEQLRNMSHEARLAKQAVLFGAKNAKVA